MHRPCPLLLVFLAAGECGREGARTARCQRGPQGCTALARFLAFLAAGEYGVRRRENGPLSAGPPGVHRPCPLLGKARAYFSQLTFVTTLTGVNRWPLFTNCN